MFPTLNRYTSRAVRAIATLFACLLFALPRPTHAQDGGTTLEYQSFPNVSVSLTRVKSGLWKVRGAVGIEPLGVVSLSHTFDFREDRTYIILRDRDRGTDQIFEISMKSDLKLHVTGEHELSIRKEGENRFIIEDDAISGELTVKLYPEGQVIDRLPLSVGEDWVFLTGNRMRRDYSPLTNIFTKDEELSLNSVDSIVYRKEFGSRKLVINWVTGVTTPPIVINFSVNTRMPSPLDAKMLELEKKLSIYAPEVKFRREIGDLAEASSLAYGMILMLMLLPACLAVTFTAKSCSVAIGGIGGFISTGVISLFMTLFSPRDGEFMDAALNSAYSSCIWMGVGVLVFTVVLIKVLNRKA